MLVPLAGDEALFAHNAYAGRRYFIVAKQAANTLDGKVIEVLLHRTPQPVDTLALFTSLYRGNQNSHLTAPAQGEGYVFLYSANYQYLTGRHFEQGRFLPANARLAFQPRPGTTAVSSVKSADVGGEATTNMAPPVGAPCLDWYSGETGKYITTTGDCSGLGSGGAGDVPPVYTGGGGPCGGHCGGVPGPRGFGGGGSSSGGLGNNGDGTTTNADGSTSVAVILSGPKIDPQQENRCFNKSQGATITVYVQQAVPNTANLYGGQHGVGHTFIGIEQSGITRYMGYYPQTGANQFMVGLGVNYTGELRENSGEIYHISITKPVNESQFSAIINYVNNFPRAYNLNNYNCADFGIAVGNLEGMKLPSTTTSAFFGKFEGRSPGELGQNIRGMSATAGASINSSGGNAPTKQGTCP